MKTKIMATALAMAAVLTQKSAEAETCYYNPNGSGTWTDASRWYKGKVPQSGDNAYITNGTMRITSADLAVVSPLNAIVTGNRADVVEFDLDEEFHFTKRIIGQGKIVKKGGGALYLDVYYATLLYTNGGIEVDDGEVHLAEDLSKAEDKNYTFQYGPLTVNSPGKLFIRNYGMSSTPGLSGDGVITNAGSTAREILIVANESAKAGTAYAFSGTISPNVNITMSGAERQDWLGDMPYSFTIRATTGTFGVMKYGDGLGGGGSLGSYDRIAVNGNADVMPRFVYLGEGEETWKSFRMNTTPHGLIIDGGAHGGLTLSGTNYLTRSLKPAVMTQLILDGSNTTPCVWNSEVWECKTNTSLATYLIKRGTGTWKMTYVMRTELRGGVAVEKGVLETTLLRSAPQGSSIGSSTVLQSAYYGAKDPSKDVSYAILLGDGTVPADLVDATVGTLSYVGSSDVDVTNRLVALTGAGRLRNDSSKTFAWKGITARDAGACVLALDCAGSGNTATSVTNGPGTITVVKEGAGTWTLDGDFDVSAFDVRGGVLALAVETSNPSAVKPAEASLVAVASGATLRSDKLIPANEFRYDVVRGGGTLDGFSFPADGTVSVTSVDPSAKGEISLPCSFVNCTGMANLENWTLLVNGRESGSKTLKVVQSGLALVPKGFVVLMR